MQHQPPEPPWAVILGASTGTGAAIARSLARDPGLHICGFHRGNHPDDAAATEQSVHAAGRQLRWLIADAGTEEGAEQGCAVLHDLIGQGQVRVFVHSIANASLGRLASGPRPLSPRQIDRTFNSMAHSFLYWVRALLQRGLMSAGGRFLALTNPNAQNLVRDTGVIAAAKSALETYVRYLAWELGPSGYRVNALRFGATHTAALSRVVGPARLQAFESRIASVAPAGRLCTTADVGQFVSVLAGPGGAWFNGAIIDYTGGESLALYDAVAHGEVDPCSP